ncbi:class I SAM-dependent methyltransferase [Streptomyces eurythermus]|uniref:class I SAM-dependent methyltransferase n=1 Tax=Streptomyces eurythermus TaxID=42237 RepID=UPI0033FF0E7E
MQAANDSRTEADDPYAVMSYYYDTFAAVSSTAAQTAPHASAFLSFAKPGDRVVDLGAGTGSTALPLAELGCTVHAAEPSRSMRSVLLSKLAARPQLHPRLTVTDLDVPFPEADYAMLAGVLQCLSPHRCRELLTRVVDCLRPGGLVALDMVGHEPVCSSPLTRVAEARAGRCGYEMWVESAPLAGPAGRQRIEYRQYLDGKLLTSEAVVRSVYVHTRQEVHAELTGLGFTVLVPPETSDLPVDFVIARRD